MAPNVVPNTGLVELRQEDSDQREIDLGKWTGGEGPQYCQEGFGVCLHKSLFECGSRYLVLFFALLLTAAGDALVVVVVVVLDVVVDYGRLEEPVV